jgi:nitrile hydratase
MNGAHDLGGAMGFGPVVPESEAVRFHAVWERRALALTLASGAAGGWTIDESRHARESLHPADYLTSAYYEIWIKGLEALLLARGMVTAGELAGANVATDGPPPRRVLHAAEVPAVLASGGPCDRPPTSPARFAAGDEVRTRNIHPRGHTRLPRYARAKHGTVVRLHGAHVFPDTNAHGQGEQPHWLYTVQFTGRELWGDDADPGLRVSIDAWEPYLDPA